MNVTEAQRLASEVYNAARALNAKMQEARSKGMVVAVMLHPATCGQTVVVTSTVPPSKLTA